MVSNWYAKFSKDRTKQFESSDSETNPTPETDKVPNSNSFPSKYEKLKNEKRFKPPKGTSTWYEATVYAKFGEDRSSGLRVLVRKRTLPLKLTKWLSPIRYRGNTKNWKMKNGLNPQKAHLHDMKQLYAKFGEDRSSGLRVLVRKRTLPLKLTKWLSPIRYRGNTKNWKMKNGLNPQKAHLHDMKQLYAKFGEDRSSGLRVLVRKRTLPLKLTKWLSPFRFHGNTIKLKNEKRF